MIPQKYLTALNAQRRSVSALLLVFVTSQYAWSAGERTCEALFSTHVTAPQELSKSMQGELSESLLPQLGLFNYKYIPTENRKGDVAFTIEEIRTSNLAPIAKAHISPFLRRWQRLAQLQNGTLDRFRDEAAKFGLTTDQEIILAVELRKPLDGSPMLKAAVLGFSGERDLSKMRAMFQRFQNELESPSLEYPLETPGGRIPNPRTEAEAYKLSRIENVFPEIHILILFLAGEPIPQGRLFSDFAVDSLTSIAHRLYNNENANVASAILAHLQRREDMNGYRDAVLANPLWNVWNARDLEKFRRREAPFIFDRSHPSE